MSQFDLTGRVAIVTGGNGGIGLGMAKGMAAAGATVVVAGRDAAKNAAAVGELQALGATASFIPVDVLEEESCRALIAIGRSIGDEIFLVSQLVRMAAEGRAMEAAQRARPPNHAVDPELLRFISRPLPRAAQRAETIEG